CQYFGTNIGKGASAGRACLQARLDYVLGKGGTLKPTDLKTLGQFILLGDPSLTPVAETPHLAAIPLAGTKARGAMAAVERHARLNRRAGLVARASAVSAFRLRPAGAPGGGKSGVFTKLRKLAAEHGIKAPDVVLSYRVGPAAEPAVAAAKGFAPRA